MVMVMSPTRSLMELPTARMVRPITKGWMPAIDPSAFISTTSSSAISSTHMIDMKNDTNKMIYA